MLAAAGYNIRWLLRQIVKMGLTFLDKAFLRLLQVLKMQLDWLHDLYSWDTLPRTARSCAAWG